MRYSKNGGYEHALRKYLDREYNSLSFLDNALKDIALNLPGVSAVIPTFNRSPHTVEEDSNPLGWCLESLLSQRESGLNEIIIIDDGSTDHTQEVVKSFSEAAKNERIQIRYLQNSRNFGSSMSRNIGVKESRNDRIIFLDDDCIFSRYMVFGANFTLNNLDEDTAAVHLPVYHRKTIPRPIKKSEIGSLDIENCVFKGNYDGFPICYLGNKGQFMNEELKILAPLEIKNLGGVFIIKKDMFNEVGGFPEFFTWKNGYREETHVALKLAERGHKMFFTPEPKFSCIHLKYGAQGKRGERNAKADETLVHKIKLSNSPKVNTGNRTHPSEWFSCFIKSTYVTLRLQNKEAASKYARKIYRQFVVNNELSVSGTRNKIPDKSTRERIYHQAINSGDLSLPRM